MEGYAPTSKEKWIQDWLSTSRYKSSNFSVLYFFGCIITAPKILPALKLYIFYDIHREREETRWANTLNGFRMLTQNMNWEASLPRNRLKRMCPLPKLLHWSFSEKVCDSHYEEFVLGPSLILMDRELVWRVLQMLQEQASPHTRNSGLCPPPSPAHANLQGSLWLSMPS